MATRLHIPHPAPTIPDWATYTKLDATSPTTTLQTAAIACQLVHPYRTERRRFDFAKRLERLDPTALTPLQLRAIARFLPYADRCRPFPHLATFPIVEASTLRARTANNTVHWTTINTYIDSPALQWCIREPVTLTCHHSGATVELGYFECQIRLRSDSAALYARPIGRSHYSGNYFHPHFAGTTNKDTPQFTSACMGELGPMLRDAIASGQIELAIDLATDFVHSYGDHPYQTLHSWAPTHCPNCNSGDHGQELILPDEDDDDSEPYTDWLICSVCGEECCDDCSRTAQDTDEVICADCKQECDCCNEWFSPDACFRSCPCCSDSICDDCWN